MCLAHLVTTEGTRVQSKCNVITITVSKVSDESLHKHSTNERRVRKRDKKVRRDVIVDNG